MDELDGCRMLEGLRLLAASFWAAYRSCLGETFGGGAGGRRAALSGLNSGSIFASARSSRSGRGCEVGKEGHLRTGDLRVGAVGRRSHLHRAKRSTANGPRDGGLSRRAPSIGLGRRRGLKYQVAAVEARGAAATLQARHRRTPATISFRLGVGRVAVTMRRARSSSVRRLFLLLFVEPVRFSVTASDIPLNQHVPRTVAGGVEAALGNGVCPAARGPRRPAALVEDSSASGGKGPRRSTAAALPISPCANDYRCLGKQTVRPSTRAAACRRLGRAGALRRGAGAKARAAATTIEMERTVAMRLRLRERASRLRRRSKVAPRAEG